MTPLPARLLATVAMILLLGGCAANVNMAHYHESGIDGKNASSELPQYIKDKKRPRVAVLPISDTTQFKDKLDLGQSVQDSLTQLLVESGSVEVMERAQLNSFMEEMKLQSSVGADVDPDQFAKIAKDIDTVFVGALTSASATATFTAEKNWTDKKGKKHHSPPSCAEQAKVIINFRALASPSATIINSFQVKGQKSSSREVRRSSECTPQNPGGFLSEAIHKAIDDAREDIANTFPSFGYIYKTMTSREDPNQRIALINLGRRDGLEPGNKVDIIEFVDEKDRVKGGTRKVIRIIAEGKVALDQFLEESAILLIPEEAHDRVLVGHAVRTKANLSMFRILNKALK